MLHLFILKAWAIVSGEMRLSELIFVLFLLLWACIGSTTVARKTMVDGAKKKNNSTVAFHDARCNNKRQHLSCYYHNNNSNNNDTSSDDKRVVPTGPNPLHNR